jgi:glycosyltransferase involved in cell wall biosynthesis
VKVVHVISGLNQGGAEAMLEKLVLTGRRLDPDIEQVVVSLGGAGVVGQRIANAGIQVVSLAVGTLPGLLRRLPALARWLRAGSDSTVVQTWLWHADLVAGLCARAVGNRRIVWNLRNSMPAHPATKRSSRIVARLCAWLSRSVPARIICNSSSALRAHVRIGYCASKCVIIPNGFDLRSFVGSADDRQEVRSRWGIGSGELLVGMVARVDPLKDHPTFIRAAARVARAHPSARFVMVGEGVSRDREIRELLAESGLTSRFTVEERRADVQRVMSALDVFCLASRSEGFPNVVGEAMACATPTVATDVGDVRDIVGDARLVATPGDPDSLAACITYVLGLNEDGRRSLGARQRLEIEERYDIGGVWRRYRDLYRSL